MIIEDKFGCITEWGDYIPYYDLNGLPIKHPSVYEELYDFSPPTPEEIRFFDCYYSKPAA
jgi:hypothetical protein